MNTEITREVATKVLAAVDAGLSSGLGKRVPGHMCVEAAVCFALDLPHGDEPACVSSALRVFKINLNDAQWSSNEIRARGLRRLALIQLGSAGHLDDKEFAKRVAELAIKKAVPAALRSAAAIQKDSKHGAALLEHAVICERDGTRQAALDAEAAARCPAVSAASSSAVYAAYAASFYAVYAASSAAASAPAADKMLADFAESAVQILIGMNVPGVKWLDLAPLEV